MALNSCGRATWVSRKIVNYSLIIPTATSGRFMRTPRLHLRTWRLIANPQRVISGGSTMKSLRRWLGGTIKVYFAEERTMRMLLNWVLSALAVWIVSRVVPGIYVSGPIAALIAALAIGFVNATLGMLLKILTFPLTLITLGLFWFVINALMLKFASALVPGFVVRGFGAAFVGAILLSLVNMMLKWLVHPSAGGRV